MTAKDHGDLGQAEKPREAVPQPEKPVPINAALAGALPGPDFKRADPAVASAAVTRDFDGTNPVSLTNDATAAAAQNPDSKYISWQSTDALKRKAASDAKGFGLAASLGETALAVENLKPVLMRITDGVEEPLRALTEKMQDQESLALFRLGYKGREDYQQDAESEQWWQWNRKISEKEQNGE